MAQHHEVRLVMAHYHEVRLVMAHYHEVRLVNSTTIRPHWLEKT